jgi:hypothetical protein
MDTDKDHKDEADAELNKITEKIIGCAFRVHNTLGGGFAEKGVPQCDAH